MNALLAAALPGFAGNVNLWNDEALVNGIWAGILTDVFPTTGAPLSFIVAPEMVKGTVAESYIADFAIMQISNANPATFRKPLLCYEGKSGDSPDTWANVIKQIKDWTSKATIGVYGKIWGLAAKGSRFTVVALDRGRDDTWRGVVLPGALGVAPTFNNNQTTYDLTLAGDIVLLQNFLTWIAVPQWPNIPM